MYEKINIDHRTTPFVSFLVIVLGGLVVIVLAIGSKIRGFQPGRCRWIFKGGKNRSTISFGGKVKPSVPCRRFYGLLMIPAEYDRYIAGKINGHFSASFPASLLSVSAGVCRKALLDESGMIKAQMGTLIRSGNGHNAWDSLYDTTP
jgi:hypothetical protein